MSEKLITDVKAGDLCESKLHKGWCLVTDTRVEPMEFYYPRKTQGVFRMKILQVKEQKEYDIALRADSVLSQLRNYKFFREGAEL